MDRGLGRHRVTVLEWKQYSASSWPGHSPGSVAGELNQLLTLYLLSTSAMEELLSALVIVGTQTLAQCLAQRRYSINLY